MHFWLYAILLKCIISMDFDVKRIPSFSDGDIIQLYHLRSFQSLLIDTVAGAFQTHTTGIALKSENTLETVVLQYRPVNFSACFLPLMDFSAENFSLLWDRRATIDYASKIDTAYWQQSTYLAEINGIVFKIYMRWIQEYLKINPFFAPFAICSNMDAESCFTKSQTWETFVLDRLVGAGKHLLCRRQNARCCDVAYKIINYLMF
jgi:hypothetical protein